MDFNVTKTLGGCGGEKGKRTQVAGTDKGWEVLLPMGNCGNPTEEVKFEARTGLMQE